MKKILLLQLLLISVVSLLNYSAQDVRSQERQTLYDELVIPATEFEETDGTGLAVSKSGLSLSASQNFAVYTSPPIAAPFPFSAVLPQWAADLTGNTDLHISLRTGPSEHEWNDWQEIHTWHDMTLPGDEAITGEITFVPAAEDKHSFVQFKITLSRDDQGANPLLRELRLAFVDATAGPTTAELIERQKTLDERAAASENEQSAAGSYPKPFVISRDVWCTDPRCNYSDGLAYHSVTHLVLHHSGSFSDRDSAELMRSFWEYHYSKGWGDIGYNFVIDEEGNIFEGHLGGDDVVGIHAREANTGSMGVAVMGNYTYETPSIATQESIINLFAWKADQRDINVFDASDALPYVNHGFPHIIGHRAVNETQCPGDMAFRLLPAIRDEVAARIGLESPHIYIDELSSSFVKSNANWYVPKLLCGHDTHSWYTLSTTDPTQAVNWGEWRPDVPRSGRYQIEAYVPYCITYRQETAGAHYTISHADGISEVVIDQQDEVGLWASLGEYRLNAGTGNVIHLTDLTKTDDGLGLWFDTIRLLPLQVLPAAINEAPFDQTWLNDRQVQFTWHVDNPEEVLQTTFQVATDEQFQNLVANKEWPNAVESVSHAFAQDYGALFWRVVLRSKSGDDFFSPYTRFGIDTEPPSSSVTSILWLDWIKQYKLSWSGVDALNHVAYYDIEIRAGSGSWEPWLDQVSGTTARFSPPVPALVYEFRSMATDSLGNVEAAHITADTSTDDAESLPHAIILPNIHKH